jgi:hypothetical protein
MGNKGGPCCRERTDEDGRINYTLLFFDIHPNKSCFFSQEKNTMFSASRLPKKISSHQGRRGHCRFLFFMIYKYSKKSKGGFGRETEKEEI